MSPAWPFTFLLLLLAPASLAQSLHIGSWDRSSDPLTRSSEAILSKAYAELHQDVEFVELPLRRAMKMMLSAELDGNLHRVAELGATQTTLVRIDTPINATAVRVYTRDPTLTVLTWKTLDGMRVAYRRGVLVIESHLLPNVLRVEAKSEADVLRMVASGIVDLGLAAEPARSPLPEMALNARLRRLDTPLIDIPLFHYLLVRHRDIAARLDVVLKRMLANGEMEAIRQRALVSAK